MRSKRRTASVAGALALFVILAITTMISLKLAFLAVGVIQIGILVLLVDARPAIVSRAVSKTRRFKRRLSRRLGTLVTRLDPSMRARAKLDPGPKPPAQSASLSSAVAASRRRRERAAKVRMVRASLVFDQEWYEAQTGTVFDAIDQAIVDYLTRGHRTGYSPHPLFDQSWALPRTAPKRSESPLISYLKNEDDLWNKATSPLFDPAQLDDQLPADELGPLTAFLRDRGSDAPLPYTADTAFLRAGLTLEQVRPFLLRQYENWRANEAVLAPIRRTFDPPQPTQELTDALDAFKARTETAPLVSIILPTWNRAGGLRTAIDSIASQSYTNWELIVADDGSVDDTELVLGAASARDSRIVPLTLQHRGVSAARNAALAQAGGEFVAFLDSDNAWEPDFLLSMIAFLEHYGHDAGYSMVEVTIKGETFYRTVPATRESLAIANSIAQPAMVARRSLVAEAGGFDESLLRAVDYDLILSLSELTQLIQVPYVGLRYSEDDQDPNRISESQSMAWNFYVRDRRRWEESELPETREGLVSIVIDNARSGPEVHAALSNLRQHLGEVPAEVILLPATHSWTALRSIALAEFSTMDVKVLPTLGTTDRAPLRINYGLRAAQGEYVLVTTVQHLYTEGCIAELIAALNESDAAAVHPVVIDEKRLVVDAGVIYGSRGRDPIGLLEGLPPDWAAWSSTNVEVPGATLPILMRGSTVRALRGLNTKLLHLWADVDASQRAARAESKPVVVRTDNVVQLRAHSAFARREGSEQDVRMFASLWPEPPAGSNDAICAAGAAATFEGFTAVSVPHDPSSWSRANWRPLDKQAVQAVDRPERPLQWSIKIAAPADERAASWGDFHFAQALASALRSLGQRASVDYGANFSRVTANADDVVLSLRGLTSVPIPVEATSLVWVISHPDKVTARELSAFDLRYAASASWPQLMADQWGLEIAPLLQCTDPERFYIDDTPVPEVVGKLLMVGNSRKQYRPAVTVAVNAGLPVVIYGTDWEGFVDAEHIAGSYVANEELRRHYRSAAWALNDHWVDMRDQGFISNRIFDVLASGGRLLTDDVTGIDGLFPRDVLPNGVATFGSPLDLLATVEAGPVTHYSEDSLQAISHHVRTSHSFESRAAVMVEDVRRHRSRSRSAGTS